MKCCAVFSLLTLRTDAVSVSSCGLMDRWEGWRVLLHRCAELALVNTRCPPGSSLTPLLSSRWCPVPSWEAGLSTQSCCLRSELLAPMPSSSYCREAPGQFTLQAALGWLLRRAWNSAVTPGSACAEPELPLRQSFSASMLPTRSRTHWGCLSWH